MTVETQLELLIANKIAATVNLRYKGATLASYIGTIQQPVKLGWYYVLMSREYAGAATGGKTVCHEFKLERVYSIAGSVINLIY